MKRPRQENVQDWNKGDGSSWKPEQRGRFFVET